MVEEVNSARCCKKRSEDENWKSTGFGEKVLRNCEWLWGRGGGGPCVSRNKDAAQKSAGPHPPESERCSVVSDSL